MRRHRCLGHSHSHRRGGCRWANGGGSGVDAGQADVAAPSNAHHIASKDAQVLRNPPETGKVVGKPDRIASQQRGDVLVLQGGDGVAVPGVNSGG